MKSIFSFLITIISISSFAQDSIKIDTNQYKKHQFGITYSPDLNFRFLHADANSLWVKEIADSLEVPKFGYTTGINYTFKISKKTGLSTGVILMDQGEKTKSNIDLQTINYTNHFYFISVPARLDYTFITRKVDVYATLGISGNFFINHKTVMSVEGKKDPIQFNNHSNIEKFVLGGMAGIGMNAKLSKNWLFKTEVLYRQTIQSISNSSVKKWLYSVGPNIGVSYSF